MNREENKDTTPASPEVQPANVREELDQDDITHQGHMSEPSRDKTDAQKHMGAMEDNVTNVMPPVAGPADLVGKDEGDQNISARKELTPG